MAIFSNFEGTMKPTFVLGKNGGRISYLPGEEAIAAQDYKGTKLIPISAADPVEQSHVVTLAYFNTHGGGGSGGGTILKGTTVPDQSTGEDGNVYFQVDDTNIVDIFIKDAGVWKPFNNPVPPTDSDYVTSFIVQPNDFVSASGMYVYTLQESIHNRGAGVLVQVQDATGNSVQPEVLLDNIGNITLRVLDQPSEYYIIKLIGETTMTTPYSAPVNKAQWVLSGDMYVLTIPATTHNQAAGPLYIAIYENVVDGATSVAPYTLISTDSIIDGSGNVTFRTYAPLSGKIVISGK